MLLIRLNGKSGKDRKRMRKKMGKKMGKKMRRVMKSTHEILETS